MARYVPPRETWRRKFAVAARGIAHGFRGQRSFWVHLPVAVAVIVGATLHNVSRTEWAILILCITMVLAAELMNTAVELLAKAITEDENKQVGLALDLSSGAVLVTAIGAAAVGCIILLTRLADVLLD